jgi:hypothetical protein
MLPLGGLHVKQRGIWVPTQHLLWDQGKARKTLIELAGRKSHTEHTEAVRTSQETHYVSATEPNRLILFEERVAVYCQSQSYFTTDGQSVGSSWCRAQFGTFDQRYCLL